MPAPTPIQIRYGPAGLLAQAASLVGQGDQWQAQHAQDMQFINSRLANADRLQQDVLNSQQNANRLQQAYAARQPAPTSYDAATQGGDQNTLLKNTYLQSAANDIPDAEKANLAALAGSKLVSPDQFRLAVADAAKRGAASTNETTEAASKAEYAKQVVQNMPPEAQAGFLALAQDKKTSAAQLRVAGDAIIQRAGLGKRVQTSQQIRGLDNQSLAIKQQMEQLVRAAAKEGIDLNTMTPAQANPTYRDPSQGVSSGDATSGIFNRVADKVLPGAGGTLVSGGNPQAMKIMVAYQKMKNQLNTLQSQRASLAGGSAGAGDMADPTSVHVENGGQIVSVSSPEEAAQLPVGQAFVTPDGEVRVRH